MTVTPLPGAYLVHFSATQDIDTVASEVCFAVAINAVIETASERCIEHDTADTPTSVAIAGYYLPTVVSGDSVAIRWKREIAGSATVYNRSMTVVKVR